MDFKYVINEQEDHETLNSNFCIQRSPLKDEVIKVEKNSTGFFDVSANKNGWIYLAKVCLEMAYLAEKDPLFHSHRTSSFEISTDQSSDALNMFHLKRASSESRLV